MSHLGSINLIWNGVVIKNINLQALVAKNREVFQAAAFATVQTGTLQIKITSKGKPVDIDGVGVSAV